LSTFRKNAIDLTATDREVRLVLGTLVAGLLPARKRVDAEYITLDPHGAGRRLGSLKIADGLGPIGIGIFLGGYLVTRPRAAAR
jgi:hypothetical protein